MDRFLPTLIAEQADAKPGALAVSDGARRLTYAQLQAEATALRLQLQQLGVGRDSVVGVALPRSADQIVASLAIMGAGASYLPIDPGHPVDRSLFELADSGAEVLVCEASASYRFADAVAHRLSPPFRSRISANGVVAPALCGDLAYVIYTSGSSGRPKGVEIRHEGLSNLVDWHVARFAVAASDRASHVAAVGFDAAAWEVWPYLATGASVVVGDDTLAKDPEGFRDWLVANQITLAYASAPIAERLIRLPWPADPTLRALLTGADRLHEYPAPTLPFELYNNYGPTEATVVATSCRVLPSGSERLPSIGKPLPHVRIYIVDPLGTQVPAGTEGEVWIGGTGVARGYRNRDEATARSFGPDPFDSSPGARIYRTGDLGRYLPSGDIAFTGRKDEQIKIRGYRIEPGEVERSLNDHPRVEASAVVMFDVAPGDQRIAAYIVAEEPRPSLSELRGFLAQRLPSYMMPSTFMCIASLPLTENGKLDRNLLRACEAEVLVDDRCTVARTPTEERLTEIVAQLLRVDTVSVDDNFFMLGGHSLLGTQLIARIRDAFGIKISLRYLFESPTIAALASEIDRNTIRPLERATVSFTPPSDRAEIPA